MAEEIKNETINGEIMPDLETEALANRLAQEIRETQERLVALNKEYASLGFARPRLTNRKGVDVEDLFLANIELNKGFNTASRAVGISPATVRRFMNLYPDFAAQLEEAQELGTERMEEQSIARAMDKSDLLMMFHLKARRPEVYREPKAAVIDIKTIGGSPWEELVLKLKQLEKKQLEEGPGDNNHR